MADVSAALCDLVPETVIYKTLTREAGLNGVIQAETTAAILEYEARVIPADPKEINLDEVSATVKEAFSFYFFDSVPFKINDILNYRGVDYKIYKGWDRDLNGNYTKIIAGIEGQAGYTQATL